MDTFLFWFFSALFFVQDNWFLIFKFLWFAWGAINLPEYYKDIMEQLDVPILRERIGTLWWCVKPVVLFSCILFLVLFPAGRILGFLFFRNKKD